MSKKEWFFVEWPFSIILIIFIFAMALFILDSCNIKIGMKAHIKSQPIVERNGS